MPALLFTLAVPPLQAHQAGDTVVVVVRRGDQTLRLTAILGKRS